MGIKARLGCLACNYSEEKRIELPFDCDCVPCPKCGELSGLSIISFCEDTKIKDIKVYKRDIIQDLIRIRQL